MSMWTEKVSTARKAGYSDDEIKNFLSSDSTYSSKFKQAFDAGYGVDEVAGFLDKKEAAPVTPTTSWQPTWAQPTTPPMLPPDQQPDNSQPVQMAPSAPQRPSADAPASILSDASLNPHPAEQPLTAGPSLEPNAFTKAAAAVINPTGTEQDRYNSARQVESAGALSKVAGKEILQHSTNLAKLGTRMLAPVAGAVTGTNSEDMRKALNDQFGIDAADELYKLTPEDVSALENSSLAGQSLVSAGVLAAQIPEFMATGAIGGGAIKALVKLGPKAAEGIAWIATKYPKLAKLAEESIQSGISMGSVSGAQAAGEGKPLGEVAKTTAEQTAFGLATPLAGTASKLIPGAGKIADVVKGFAGAGALGAGFAALNPNAKPEDYITGALSLMVLHGATSELPALLKSNPELARIADEYQKNPSSETKLRTDIQAILSKTSQPEISNLKDAIKTALQPAPETTPADLIAERQHWHDEGSRLALARNKAPDDQKAAITEQYDAALKNQKAYDDLMEASNIKKPMVEGEQPTGTVTPDIEAKFKQMQAEMPREAANAAPDEKPMEDITVAGQTIPGVEVDRLTGIPGQNAGRKMVDEALKNKWHILHFDIDDFKAVNEEYTHEGGDDVLRGIGAAIKQNFGSDGLDVPHARIGGEEFIVTFPPGKFSDEAVKSFIDDVGSNVTVKGPDGKEEPITLSGGVGIGRKEFEGKKALHADILGKQAKDAGKNQIIVDNGLTSRYNISGEKKERGYAKRYKQRNFIAQGKEISGDEALPPDIRDEVARTVHNLEEHRKKSSGDVSGEASQKQLETDPWNENQAGTDQAGDNAGAAPKTGPVLPSARKASTPQEAADAFVDASPRRPGESLLDYTDRLVRDLPPDQIQQHLDNTEMHVASQDGYTGREQDNALKAERAKQYRDDFSMFLGKLDSKSFGREVDPNLKAQNKRWFTKTGGWSMDQAISELHNRFPGRYDDVETASDFYDLLEQVPTADQVEGAKMRAKPTDKAVPKKPPKITQTDALGGKEKTPSQMEADAEILRREEAAKKAPAPDGPLFDGNEALTVEQQDAFKKDEKGTTLYAGLPLDEMGKLVKKVGKEAADRIAKAATAVKEFLAEDKKGTKYSGNLDSDYARLGNKQQADEIRLRKILDENHITEKDQEAIYHWIENRSEPITPEQRLTYEQVIKPIRDARQVEEESARADEIPSPVYPNRDTYTPRNVAGVGGPIDQLIAGAKSAGTGGGRLKTTTKADKKRVMMAATDANGNRTVVSIKKGIVQAWENGKARYLGRLKMTTDEATMKKDLAPIDAKIAKLEQEQKTLSATEGRKAAAKKRLATIERQLSDLENQRSDVQDTYDPNTIDQKKFVDRNGQEWTIGQATTKEIEANSGVRYHKNVLVNELLAYNDIRKARRAIEYLNNLKTDPEFARVGIRLGTQNLPPDYQTTGLPQLRGYAFPRKIAQTLDTFYKHSSQGLLAPENFFSIVNGFMRNAIFFNALMHPPNIGVHWLVGRGATAWIKPGAYVDLYKSSMRAAKAVLTMNKDYTDALENSDIALLYSKTVNRDLHKVMLNALGKELENNPRIGGLLGRALGYANRANFVKAIYSFSNHVTWAVNDWAMLQATYEEMGHGKTLEEAAKDVGKHIPTYRIPAHILGSSTVSNLMKTESLITMFGAYHYGALKSYGEMAKSLIGPKASVKERAEALDKIAMLAITSLFIYPQLDKIAKWATGNKNAKFRRAGATTFPYKTGQFATGKIEFADYIQSIMTPSVGLQYGVQFATGRDWRTGKQTSPLETIARSIAPFGQGEKLAKGQVHTKDYLLSLIGISSPKTNIDEMSPAEVAAHKIKIGKMPGGGFTPEQDKKHHSKADVLDKYSKSRDEKVLDDAVSKNILTKQDKNKAVANIDLTPLQVSVQGLSESEIEKVMSKATPAEKQQIEEVGTFKIREILKNLESAKPEDRQALKDEAQQAIRDRAVAVRKIPAGEARKNALTKLRALQTEYTSGLRKLTIKERRGGSAPEPTDVPEQDNEPVVPGADEGAPFSIRSRS